MRSTSRTAAFRLLTPFIVLALLASLTGSAAAADPRGRGASDDHAGRSDNLPGKLAQKQAQLKAKAQAMVLKGEAKAVGKNQVVKVANGQFVELAFEGEDQILTLLAEFGDGDVTHNHGTLGNITHTGDAFPHNNIPEPDRSVDNTTIWTEDFSQDYYDNLLYNEAQRPSMANYYLDQSVAEIAMIVQVPVGTVRSRLHYAKRALRAAVDAERRPVPNGGRSV